MSKTAFSRITAGMFVPAALLGLTLTCVAGCGKAPPDGAAAGAARSDAPLLTQEEVGAILGNPVTSVEGAATDLAYKTAVVGIEVTVGIERENDAQLAMSGARKATGMLGGTPEDVPNLGEEAFFGAMSVLYVRRGDMVITITPPNLQLAAGYAAYDKMAEAKLGSPEHLQALKELQAVEKTQARAIGVALAAKVLTKL